MTYDHVQFVTEGTVIELTMEGEFVFGCGLEPSTFNAKVPCTEFDKLNLDTASIWTGAIENFTGSILFYSSSDPTVAGNANSLTTTWTTGASSASRG